MDDLLTLKEAGEILKRSRSALYLMIGRGDLTAFKHGRMTVIRRSEVQRYLAELPQAVVTPRPALQPPGFRLAGAAGHG